MTFILKTSDQRPTVQAAIAHYERGGAYTEGAFLALIDVRLSETPTELETALAAYHALFPAMTQEDADIVEHACNG